MLEPRRLAGAAEAGSISGHPSMPIRHWLGSAEFSSDSRSVKVRRVGGSRGSLAYPKTHSHGFRSLLAATVTDRRYNPQSTIHYPQSTIHNPLSTIHYFSPHSHGVKRRTRCSYSADSGNSSRSQRSSRRALASKNGMSAAATSSAGQLCQTNAQPNAAAMTLV